LQRLCEDLAVRYPGGVSTDFNFQSLEHPGLGATIKVEENESISIHQHKYLRKLFRRYNKKGSKQQITWMVDQVMEDRDHEAFDKQEYVSLVGAIQAIAMCSRPDMMHAVRMALKQAKNPTRGDFRRAIGMVHYLKDTEHEVLNFRRTEPVLRLECQVKTDGECYGYTLMCQSMGNAPVHGFAGVWPESKKNQGGLIFSVIRQAVEQLMQLREIFIDVRLDTLGDLQRQVIVVNTDYNVTGSMAMRLMAGDSDESVKDDITTVSRWIAQRVIEMVLVN